MILAVQTPQAFAIVIDIVIFVGLVGFALCLFRGVEYFARRSLERTYFDLAIHPDPMPDDVTLTYHTYHGFIAWFTQTRHQVALPPEDARILLGRLLRFNLSWGLLTYGALFIPPLAILNYFSQRRSIAAQAATGGHPELQGNSGDQV